MACTTVIGATGRVGALVAARLAARGERIVAVVRRPERLAPGFRHEVRKAELTQPGELSAALRGARRIACCVHARHAISILAAVPRDIERIVVLGSTRKFTRYPDDAADEVRAAEFALAQSGLPAVMLHPTMIYGAAGENNVQRIAALIRRLGIVPLPRGGRSLIQPIYVDDVARCVVAALDREAALGPPIVAAGPDAVTYREFVAAIGRAIGKTVTVIGIPMALAILAARATGILPFLPRVRPDEVRRLTEDKAFATAEMRTRLGIVPVDLALGLQRTFCTPPPGT